jgi:hypothetical protein
MPTVKPRFECLFCGNRGGHFSHDEHPIPESLGNDDIVLDRGFVCDQCNQYFGSKVEAKVLGNPPFSLERMAFAVPSKKGKLVAYHGDGFSLYSTGSSNRLAIVGYGDLSKANMMLDNGMVVVAGPDSSQVDLLARFMLKMGVELLCRAEEVDPYDDHFRSARRCARYGDRARKWDVAYGIYPRRSDLLISIRTDELGDLEEHQIYQYELGIMPDGDVVFCFAYTQHVFACNLSRPVLDKYIEAFNAKNLVQLNSRWPSHSSDVGLQKAALDRSAPRR